MKINLISINLIKYYLFIILFFLGLLIYKDFGFNIDEQFQRLNGFYWLNYLSRKFNLESLETISTVKLNNISGFTLPSIDVFNKYGIIFDVPAALIEVFLNTDRPIEYYQMRHLLVFLYFFISLVFLYKIIINRFKNQSLALIIVILFFIIPRLLGDSFQNNKDIIFLSFVIISYYYFFKTIDKSNKKNIILFSLFSAIAITVRMFGVFFPILFISYFILSRSKFSKSKNDIKINNLILYFLLLIFFLIIFWPYLWENPIKNFIDYFKTLDLYPSPSIYFLGNYYTYKYLPYSYLPIWIIISTPILHLFLFIIGFYFIFFRFFKRLLKISETSNYNDLWRGNNEVKDNLILFGFLSTFLVLIFFNLIYYNSWRFGYFLYFFIIYFSAYFLNLINIKNRKKNKFLYFSKLLLLLFILFTIVRNIIYHPYQSLYFNILIPDKIKNSVEIDYTGLSSIHFLEHITKISEDLPMVKIGVASWHPLWRMIELLDDKYQKKIVILENKKRSLADYIYTSRISEVDKKINKKYEIPSNFDKHAEFKIDGAIIYEIYKKK